MWVLIIVVLTTKGLLVPYEQGTYKTFDECYSMKQLLIEDLGESYKATCMEWK